MKNQRYVESLLQKVLHKRYNIDWSKLSEQELMEVIRILRDVDEEIMTIKRNAVRTPWRS